MAVTAKLEAEARWFRAFQSAEAFTDDLGSIGAWVGPRTGPNKRSHGEMEDYDLRRLLVAWKETKRLDFPFDVRAETDWQGEPDFVLKWPDGKTLGVEATAAGAATWQKWLTGTDQLEGAVLHPREEGYVGDEPEQIVVQDVLQAIRKKLEQADAGKYASVPACDLLIYENSEGGVMAEKDKVISMLRGDAGAEDCRKQKAFRQIHLVIGKAVVFLDLFGAHFQKVDVSKTYEIDYAGWLTEQVQQLRRGDTEKFDLAHIAEELESLAKTDRRKLGSHLRNLILHLLKWEYQPGKRANSWQKSIVNARTEIEELVSDSPSLGNYLFEQLPKEYVRARKLASVETGSGIETFPENCPYELEQVLDLEYLPDEQGQSSGG